MTERERLIEILKTPINTRVDADPAEVIADCLLDNGVIVPPCKVGDTVYFETYNVKGDCVGVKPHKIAYLYNRAVTKEIVSDYLPYEEFGKTVFLTREAAEKALEEKEREKNEKT